MSSDLMRLFSFSRQVGTVADGLGKNGYGSLSGGFENGGAVRGRL